MNQDIKPKKFYTIGENLFQVLVDTENNDSRDTIDSDPCPSLYLCYNSKLLPPKNSTDYEKKLDLAKREAALRIRRALYWVSQTYPALRSCWYSGDFVKLVARIHSGEPPEESSATIPVRIAVTGYKSIGPDIYINQWDKASLTSAFLAKRYCVQQFNEFCRL